MNLPEIIARTKIGRLLYKRAVAIPPVIVVGMHRSGTSLLARILEECGVFMGDRKTINAESPFFQAINKDALDMFGCSWRCLDYLPESEALWLDYTWLHQQILEKIRNGIVNEFWMRKWLYLIKPEVLMWGWKDPRNSLLLPVWKKIFPDAAVVHICRDGRDVALSLLKRECAREGYKNLVNMEIMKNRFIANINLWEQYIRRIEEAMPLFKRFHNIKYEELITNPGDEVKKLCQTIGLPIRNSIEAAVATVDSSRAQRHKQSSAAWTKKIKIESMLLEKHGYL